MILFVILLVRQCDEETLYFKSLNLFYSANSRTLNIITYIYLYDPRNSLLAMLTHSTNIQSYLSAIRLSSTTLCFHLSGIFYNYILYSVVLLSHGCCCTRMWGLFQSLTFSYVWCVSGVNLTFILFLPQLWTMKR